MHPGAVRPDRGPTCRGLAARSAFWHAVLRKAGSATEAAYASLESRQRPPRVQPPRVQPPKVRPERAAELELGVAARGGSVRSSLGVGSGRRAASGANVILQRLSSMATEVVTADQSARVHAPSIRDGAGCSARAVVLVVRPVTTVRPEPRQRRCRRACTRSRRDALFRSIRVPAPVASRRTARGTPRPPRRSADCA